MVVEEVRYDFADYPKYADDFVRDLVKLMIMSKMNSTARNTSSKAYFQKLVSQMEGCEANVVKYGQPLLYVKYRGVQFTDQKVTSQFVRTKNHVIDVTMESVFGEFVKTFDSLASMSESKVKWGVVAGNEKEKPEPMFALLDKFVEAVGRLTMLDPESPNSLAGRRFGIRNASVARKSLHIEFLIDGRLHIIELNPGKRKEKAAELLFGSSEAAKAIAALMIQ
ncbi:MAG: hypothetical protein ABI348_01155 [Nitrososphaera sp.]